MYGGAATASYQVEGAAYEDGEGLNIWDVFCKEDGHVYEHHTGDVACDQYHSYKEDVAIMKELGLKAYRFSVNWARILPEGTGKVNEKGLAYYDNLVNCLIENGIEPYGDSLSLGSSLRPSSERRLAESSVSGMVL